MLSNKEIGARIFDTRTSLDLTLDDVASRVGVAKSTIQRYEKGTIKKIKLPVLESIAAVLNVNPNWLIGNTDDPAPVDKSGNDDAELMEYLEYLRTRPEARILMSTMRGATKEEVEENVRFIEALRKSRHGTD